MFETGSIVLPIIIAIVIIIVVMLFFTFIPFGLWITAFSLELRLKY